MADAAEHFHGKDLNDDGVPDYGICFSTMAADIGGQLVVCAVVASFTVLLVHHAHTVYLREREAFLQGGADGISPEEQVRYT